MINVLDATGAGSDPIASYRSAELTTLAFGTFSRRSLQAFASSRRHSAMRASNSEAARAA